MPESPQSQFRLPHWGWFLLATVVVAVGFFGLSIWLPYHREQPIIQRIEYQGAVVIKKTMGPDWLWKFVGEDRMNAVKFFERASIIDMNWTATDSEIAHLSRLTNVTRIGLYGTKVTDAGLAHLRGLNHLNGLILSSTAVTDSGLGHLSGLSHLRELHLNGTAITDAGLAQLSGLKNLTYLDIRATQVTEQGINRLKAALPDCDIHHRPGSRHILFPARRRSM